LPFPVDYWEAQNLWNVISRQYQSFTTTDPDWDRKFHELGTKLDIEVDQLAVDK
jgi:hypothetical protein